MSRLPTIDRVLFLGATGFMGLRCPCGFVVTARTAEAIHASMRAHHRAKHLDEDLDIVTEDTLET